MLSSTIPFRSRSRSRSTSAQPLPGRDPSTNMDVGHVEQHQSYAGITVPTIHIMNDFANDDDHVNTPTYQPPPITSAIKTTANNSIVSSSEGRELPSKHDSQNSIISLNQETHSQLQPQTLKSSSQPPLANTSKNENISPPFPPLQRFSSSKSKRDERRRTRTSASSQHQQQDLQIQMQDNNMDQSHHHTLHRRPSLAYSASIAPPMDFYDLSTIYTVVASRRDSYDNLLWQCPTLALTAQSFLFSIALDGETTRVARIISMLLSIVITTCSLQLFTRQLAAEQADRQWLINFETRHGVPYEDTAFGENWDKYSQKLPESAGFIKVLALTGSFPLWRNSLFIFLGAAISVLCISFIKPSLFEGGDSRRAGG